MLVSLKADGNRVFQKMGSETRNLSRRFVAISLGFSFLSCVLSVVAYGLPYWVYFDKSLDVPGINDVVKLKYNYGFWEYCNNVDSSYGSTSNCAKIKTHSGLEQIAVCCVLLSMLFSVNVMVNSALYVTACLNIKLCLYIAVVSAAVSGLLILLSVISYGSHDHSIKVTDSYAVLASASNLHVSFYLAVTACVVITMAVVFIAIALYRHEDAPDDDNQSVWSNTSEDFLKVRARTIVGPFSPEAEDEERITKKLMQVLYKDQEAVDNEGDTDPGTDTEGDGGKSEKEAMEEFYATEVADSAFKVQTDKGDEKEVDNECNEPEQPEKEESFVVQIVPLNDVSSEDKDKKHNVVSDKTTVVSSGLGSSLSLLTRKTSAPEITPVETMNEGVYPNCLLAPITPSLAPESTFLLHNSTELQSTSFTVRAKTAEPCVHFGEEQGALGETSIHTVEMITTVTTVDDENESWVNEKKVYALKQNGIFITDTKPEDKACKKGREDSGRQHVVIPGIKPKAKTKLSLERKRLLAKNKETTRRVKSAYGASSMKIPAFPKTSQRPLPGRTKALKRRLTIKKTQKDSDESNA